MRKEQFVEGEFYHIYNRGVDRRLIFTNDLEKIRFIHTLYIFNNFLDIPNIFDIIKLEPREVLTPIKQHVDIVAGCIMPNHYHLVLTPKRKNGVSLFLQKIGSSHTHYFNKVHERTGRLFESTFRAKHIDRQEYANYITQYIHLNHIKLDHYRSKIGQDDFWTEVGKYKWSTLPLYLNKESPFSLVVSTDFRNNILDMNAGEYQKSLLEIDLDRS